MAVAWFFCKYNRRDIGGRPGRYCAMDDFTTLIRADGGDWSESEVLGNYALVKVRAEEATLVTINAAVDFTRVPRHTALSDTLSTLTAGEKTFLKNLILDMGYTNAEILAALGSDIGSHTLGQVLRFITTRRHAPRYDAASDTITMDGAQHECLPIEIVDDRVV